MFPVFLFTGRVYIRLIWYLSMKNSLVKLSGSRGIVLWLLFDYRYYLFSSVCMLSRLVVMSNSLWPCDNGLSVSSVCGFSRGKQYLRGFTYFHPGDLPDPGIELNCLCPLHWRVCSLLLVAPKFYFSRIVLFIFQFLLMLFFILYLSKNLFYMHF